MTKEYMILKGDCLDRLKKLPDNSIDSVVTDPPYGLSKEPDIVEVLTKWMNGEPYDHGHGGFMGKRWDSFVPHPDIWREVHRVLKPGGHALVFAGTRTQDLMTIALRLAGFEVRDVIEWLYFSGFPKSMDVSKAFDKRAKKLGVQSQGFSVAGDDGRKAELKQNLKYRSDYGYVYEPVTDLARKWDGWGTALKPAHEPIIVVRKPLEGTVCDNVERWGTGAINVDGCRILFCGNKPKATSNQNIRNNAYKSDNSNRERDTVYIPSEKGRFPANIVTTEPDAFWSKYSNVTPQELSKKASKRDRNSDWRGEEIALRNSHPTVKPIDLMAWLVRLVTPPGGTVLDPFAGSGSTLVAAKREGFGFIGIEREDEYVEIIEVRTGEIAQ
ncbi:site-specific DNA-methyltransferase [Aeribacillus sp. FSL K6-1121]|uniref:DNA-methyltransferase n=1 Tax=Aeribacillus sp. FSL K6-1121 TaxID=2954745 RepID=UPI0030F5EDFB